MSSNRQRKVVGLGGTFRQASSSERIVRAVLAACERLGAATSMFDGPALARLPHFNPEDAQRTPEQAAAIARVADGVVVGSAIIDVIAANGVNAPAAVRAYIESLAAAVHSARKQLA